MQVILNDMNERLYQQQKVTRMKIVVLKEQAKDEARVAITPDTVKRFLNDGHEVRVQKGAGEAAGYSDAAYKKAGATVQGGIKGNLKRAELLLTVQAPTASRIKSMPDGLTVLGLMGSQDSKAAVKALAKKKATVIAMELVPRISRAQSMDVLSSQSNLAGYRAVIDGAHAFNQAFPMMMTAAGTVAPAKVFVMGTGVAGLQAIATAKRLGAVVSATDIRPAAREQVNSLGASFVMVETEETKQAETEGGYAKEMSDDYKKKQAELIADTIQKQDIVITTALIPGRPAPELVSEKMIKSMKPGSVLVDLAAANGGNCPLTEKDKVIEKHGVTLIGYTNLPARVAKDSSQMYARNLYNFISTLMKPKNEKKKNPLFDFNWDDEIVTACALVKDGQVVHETVQDKLKDAASKSPAKKSSAPKSSSPKSSSKSTKKKKTTKKKSAKSPKKKKSDQKQSSAKKSK
mgnify:CR=1 FL=1